MTKFKELKEKILHQSVGHLTRLAAVLALVGLAIMVLSILWPRPLPVILAMSAGHMVGILAFFCYLLAVVIDVSRAPARSSFPPPPGEPPPAAD
jgi:hypothetical protein